MPDGVLEGLKKIYEELEIALSGPGRECERCGDCCRFASFGHQLRVTEPELAYLIAEHGARRPVEPGVCPYLCNNRCEARQGRALGCRVFACQADNLATEVLYEAYFGKIRALASRHGFGLTIAELNERLTEIDSSMP